MKQLLLTLALGLVLASPAHAKLNVVATTPDFGALAREVGGDHIDLTTLAKPTEDPHFVDAKPSFIVKLNRADVLIEGGAELEIGWLSPLLEGARNPKLEPGKPGRIACSDGVHLLEVPTSLDRAKGDIHAAGNPHYTTDPLNAKVVVAHLAESFGLLDPKSAAYYQANAMKFIERLDAKLKEWQTLLASSKGKPIVTYHNSWPYFAKRFEVDMTLFLEPKPGIPPTPAHLAEVISKMKTGHIRLIVVEPHLSRKTAEAVAGKTEAQLLDFAQYPGAGKASGDGYVEWMDSLVHALVKGFEATR